MLCFLTLLRVPAIGMYLPICQTVIDDVTAKFENQTLEELSEQQTKIQDMLDSGKASVDSEFWEAVLKELHVFKVS